MDKKVYEKPSIYMERFELAQHIANCSWELNVQENSCHEFVGDETSPFPGVIIIDDLKGCQNLGEIKICYYSGGDGENTFAS